MAAACSSLTLGPSWERMGSPGRIRITKKTIVTRIKIMGMVSSILVTTKLRNEADIGKSLSFRLTYRDDSGG